MNFPIPTEFLKAQEKLVDTFNLRERKKSKPHQSKIYYFSHSANMKNGVMNEMKTNNKRQTKS